MTKFVLGLLTLVFIAGCRLPPAEKPVQSKRLPSGEAPAARLPPKTQKVTAPKYEIFDDSVDSTGMRLVYLGTADRFNRSQQRAIVEDVIKGEKGKNRWVRVFVRPNSARGVVHKYECLESLDGGKIVSCDMSR